MQHLTDLNWWLATALFILSSAPVHEWAHAWAAYQLGDDTAALQGRLTLNPLAHLDPLGTLTFVITGYFGWAKPVPVSRYRLRGDMRASMALVGAAGPFSNLVLAMLAAIPFRMGWDSFLPSSLLQILLYFILINLGLMLFNLIPIPPLDGSRILNWLLPREWAYAMDRIEQFGGVGLMMLLLMLSRLGILSRIVGPAMTFMLQALGVY